MMQRIDTEQLELPLLEITWDSFSQYTRDSARDPAEVYHEQSE